jgi:PAS domain S-box-containing protein
MGRNDHSSGAPSTEDPPESATPSVRDGNQLYRALFNVNTAIKLLIEPDTGRIVDANRTAEEFYGWSLEELCAMRITDINTLTDQEVRAEMAHAKSGRRTYFRFRHRTACGEDRLVEVHSGPIELNERVLLLSIIHDVTERDELERQLLETQRLDAVGRLAGSMAHEFNNLLTVMLTTTGMLGKKLQGHDVAGPHLRDLEFAIGRAGELTRGLLAFSRRQVMEPRRVHLNSVVRDLADLLQRSLGDTVVFDMDLDQELPGSRMDPRHLETLLMNLVLNARDAMPRGGTIRIVSRQHDITPENGLPVSPGSFVRLTVSDDGEGMDEQTRSRIFEPFFTTKAPGRGTGLGLATVHGIVHQSGGCVTVQSEVGLGTTFQLYLPLEQEGGVVSSTPLESVPPASVPAVRRILLVDDSHVVRKALRQGLRAHGYEVVCAASVEEARVTDWADIDALITDIVMPGTSGVVLAAEMAAAYPKMPIVILSGDPRGHDLSALPRRVARLQKPLTADDLVAALERAQPTGA